MQEEHEGRTVNRRRLLRRAGTVVAGVAGAGVVSAAFASPANASAGENLVEGTTTDVVPTTFSGNNPGSATLTLGNTGAGAPVALAPTQFGPATAAGPVGSLYTDEYGDVYGIGHLDGLGSPIPQYVTPLYSPTWATYSVPLSPGRILNTTTGASGFGRSLVVQGSATYDSAGRVNPKNSTTVPDLVLDLSGFIDNGFAAIQGNLAAVSGTANGYIALWDQGDFPGASSINFVAGTTIANFTQTVLGSDFRLRVKVSKPVIIVFDLSGLIVTDFFTQAGPLFTGSAVSGLAAPKAAQRLKRSPGN